MKKLLYFSACMIALILVTGCSDDKTPGFGSVYGIVTDAETFEPIRGAMVILSPGNLSTTTGQDGHYEFNELESGQYKIQIQTNGYQTNSRQIQVNAGSKASGDMALTPSGALSGISFSTQVLNFDKNYSELVFKISNTGNSGTISWNITDVDASWLTISPMEGSIAMGQSHDVKVKIDRTQISSEETTFFSLVTPAGTAAFMVLVGKEGSGGGNVGSDDYSSANIVQCDDRIEAKIISCKRSGSNVVFTYTLTSNGLGSVNDFRIYPPQSQTLINGAYRSVITDNTGKEYTSPSMTFRAASTAGYYILNTSFPESMACQGTVTLKDVPTSAKKITAMIGIYAYPNSQFNLADTRIYFKNVPIY